MPNRLADETSPYLLQHAENPVDWLPWGDEAFSLAKAQAKPVLLSIGYSACHWCHVMAHESFESPQIAALINEHFVPIKVDREERPDVDAIYMDAVQALTGAGGWPLTVFLTPEGRPFYGGTYYPPEDRLGHPGFRRVLSSLAEVWQTRRAEALEASESLTAQLMTAAKLPPNSEELSAEVLASALEALSGTFDATHGGFGNAPKFPPHTALEFLLLRPEPRALELATVTLDNMAEGGIYDQLGGGFSRYSTDTRWLVPHFEKMLYDNAQLVSRYAEAFAKTQNPLYRRVAENTLMFVERELRDPEGGFYSALDADSEGVEGKYYVWTAAELDALGHDAELVKARYGVTPAGNFEGHNILFVARSVEALAEQFSLSENEITQRLEQAKETLLDMRQTRIRPGLDDKILCSWNGLMVSAYADAGRVLGREDYLETARSTVRFMRSVFYQNGRLKHTYKAGQAKVEGLLEDYTYFALGLVALYRATLESEWLLLALELTETVVNDFYDSDAGGFFSTIFGDELILRPKDLFDAATPSGNGAAAELLVSLSRYTDNRAWEALALATVKPLQQAMRRYPTGFGSCLVATERLYAPPREIAVFGDRKDPATQALLAVLAAADLTFTAVTLIETPDEPLVARLPFAQNRDRVAGKPTAYVCERGACRLPVTTPHALREQLEQTT